MISIKYVFFFFVLLSQKYKECKSDLDCVEEGDKFSFVTKRRKSENFHFQSIFFYYSNKDLVNNHQGDYLLKLCLLENAQVQLSIESKYSSAKFQSSYILGRNHIEIGTDLVNWSHVQPSLYNLNFTFEGGEKKIIYKRTVGIRDVRLKNENLLINNQDISLNILSIRRDFLLDINDLKHWLFEVKKMHFNTIIIDGYPTDSLIGLSDSLGLYLFSKVSNEEFDCLEHNKFLKRNANAPSLVGWISKKNFLKDYSYLDENRVYLTSEHLFKNIKYQVVNYHQIGKQFDRTKLKKIFQPFGIEFEYLSELYESDIILRIKALDNNELLSNSNLVVESNDILGRKLGTIKIANFLIQNNEAILNLNEIQTNYNLDISSLNILMISKEQYGVFNTGDTIAQFDDLKIIQNR